jgi:hypothetical protein
MMFIVNTIIFLLKSNALIHHLRRTAQVQDRTESITLRVEKKVLGKLREEVNKEMKSVTFWEIKYSNLM